jgi:LmbE family N-acetylglucosaminyl deacetylase
VDRPLKVLCLGAHSDDIEIGCGGAILSLRETQDCHFEWVVFSAQAARAEEARKAAMLFANFGNPTIKDFEDGYMPQDGREVKNVFENLKTRISPDIVFTHYGKDAHQDHRILSELTWNTFRDHLILEYEIPKFDGDMGRPNMFMPLSKELVDRKVKYITETFRTQETKRWFRPETFTSLMRLRGMECNAESGYAEAFYCRKCVLDK